MRHAAWPRSALHRGQAAVESPKKGRKSREKEELGARGLVLMVLLMSLVFLPSDVVFPYHPT